MLTAFPLLAAGQVIRDAGFSARLFPNEEAVRRGMLALYQAELPWVYSAASELDRSPSATGISATGGLTYSTSRPSAKFSYQLLMAYGHVRPDHDDSASNSLKLSASARQKLESVILKDDVLKVKESATFTHTWQDSRNSSAGGAVEWDFTKVFAVTGELKWVHTVSNGVGVSAAAGKVETDVSMPNCTIDSCLDVAIWYRFRNRVAGDVGYGLDMNVTFNTTQALAFGIARGRSLYVNYSIQFGKP